MIFYSRCKSLKLSDISLSHCMFHCVCLTACFTVSVSLHVSLRLSHCMFHCACLTAPVFHSTCLTACLSLYMPHSLTAPVSLPVSHCACLTHCLSLTVHISLTAPVSLPKSDHLMVVIEVSKHIVRVFIVHWHHTRWSHSVIVNLGGLSCSSQLSLCQSARSLCITHLPHLDTIRARDAVE